MRGRLMTGRKKCPMHASSTFSSTFSTPSCRQSRKGTSPHSSTSSIDRPYSPSPLHGLLVFVLGMITMSGNEVSQSQLWSFLGRIGLEQKCVQFLGNERMNEYRLNCCRKLHDDLGDVSSIIDSEFTRTKKYLIHMTRTESDGPKQFYRWGPRAQFVACLHDCRPRNDSSPARSSSAKMSFALLLSCTKRTPLSGSTSSALELSIKLDRISSLVLICPDGKYNIN